MSRNQPLNNITHKDLKIEPCFSPELGDNIGSTLTFITEFSEVQKEYPILFRRAPDTKQYQAVVLFGLEKNENLYLGKVDPEHQKSPGWRANYLPAAVARGPFMIGFETRIENGEEQTTPVMHVDMDHPKVCATRGSAQALSVFLPHGGNSPYLDHIASVLNIIRDGMQLNKPMFEAFVEHDLIDNINIDIDLKNQDKHQIAGFYTINEEKLANLQAHALEQLNKSGFLQAAYFVIASLSNIKHLVDLKNKQTGIG